MNTENNKTKNKGFTIIEIMIAVGLFTVIMVIGIGAVLKVNEVHKKTQNSREVIDNLHFIIEDMSRNIRLGSIYNCRASEGGLGVAEDCPYEEGVSPYLSMAFERVDGNPDPLAYDDQVVYRIVQIPGTENYRIMKGTGIGCATHPTGSGCLILTPDEIHIDPNKSGFNISNAENSIDGVEPSVIIRLSGDIVYQSIVTPFSLQTTISQRQIDL